MPLLQSLAKDNVPNIRMNTAKTIKICLNLFKDKTYEVYLKNA